VERNRAWVHEKSGGRVGYFHLPDMMSAGFAEFHRYFSAECDRDALIVDVRYNRGGHVSSLLLEKIARKRIGYDISRWGRPIPYPDEAVAGHRPAGRHPHVGRCNRDLAEAQARRWNGDDATGVLVLVQRCRLGSRELRH
jgi:tricorn protease